nr:hypothetical protein [Tanacetum cinerariifolium]
YWILGVDQRHHRSLKAPAVVPTIPSSQMELSESSCSCSDYSFISDGAKRYGARATGAALRIRSIWNSTGRAGGRPGKSSGNTSGKS